MSETPLPTDHAGAADRRHDPSVLRPKLFAELNNGTRIVSHAFDMAEWEPEKQLKVDGRDVYYWTINDAARAKFGAPAKK